LFNTLTCIYLQILPYISPFLLTTYKKIYIFNLICLDHLGTCDHILIYFSERGMSWTCSYGGMLERSYNVTFPSSLYHCMHMLSLGIKNNKHTYTYKHLCLNIPMFEGFQCVSGSSFRKCSFVSLFICGFDLGTSSML